LGGGRASRARRALFCLPGRQVHSNSWRGCARGRRRWEHERARAPRARVGSSLHANHWTGSLEILARLRILVWERRRAGARERPPGPERKWQALTRPASAQHLRPRPSVPPRSHRLSPRRADVLGARQNAQPFMSAPPVLKPGPSPAGELPRPCLCTVFRSLDDALAGVVLVAAASVARFAGPRAPGPGVGQTGELSLRR
jgi:hypothetical protein